MPIDEQTSKETIVEKKSKKKIIAVISTIGIVTVPIIFALLSMTNSPDTSNMISVHDFPVERFVEGFDILCNKYPDKSFACLVKNDGTIELSLGNGIYNFQTVDYSLMKAYWSDIGEEEKSISYAFYADGASVRVIDGENWSMWLLTPAGRQTDINYRDF